MRRFLPIIAVSLLGGCIFSPGLSPDGDAGGSNNSVTDMADDGSSPPDDGGTLDGGGGTEDSGGETDASVGDASPPQDMTEPDASPDCPNDCGPCRVCDPDEGVCVDGDDPTECDTDLFDCQTAVCIDGACDAMLNDGWCLIDGECHEAGRSPDNSCLSCAPENNVDEWTSVPAGVECTEYQQQCLSSVCDGNAHCLLVTDDQIDGTSCNGGMCPQGVSRSCSAGLCLCPIQGTFGCSYRLNEYSVGDDHPDDPCMWCGPEDWETRPDGAACQTGGDPGSCMSGECEPF